MELSFIVTFVSDYAVHCVFDQEDFSLHTEYIDHVLVSFDLDVITLSFFVLLWQKNAHESAKVVLLFCYSVLLFSLAVIIVCC